jgi:hypothetical protein
MYITYCDKSFVRIYSMRVYVTPLQVSRGADKDKFLRCGMFQVWRAGRQS